jgi:hypothetical protein
MKTAAILGISVLFIALSFGTVTGLYQFDIVGLNILGENADISFILMFLGTCGIAYWLFKTHWIQYRRT